MSFFKKQPLPYGRGGYFIGGFCIIFSIFFYLVMFHDPQTWDPMFIEKT
jgi:hypothetical protein